MVRTRVALWLAATVLLGTASCSSAPRGDLKLVVQVLGTRDAFGAFAVSGTDLTTDSPRYTTPYFEQELTFSGALTCGEGPTINLAVSDAAGDSVASQTLEPFLCNKADDCQERLARGMQGVETHQLFLTADGELQKNTDFERRLAYTCTWRSPDGDEDATASFQADAGSCQDPSRSHTNATLADIDQQGDGGSAETCNGYLVGYEAGVLVAQLTFPTHNGQQAFVNLAFCLERGPLVLPLVISAEALREPSCPRGGASLALGSGASERRLQPVEGVWQVDALDLGRDGQQTGSVSLTFGADESPEVVLQGDIVLPNVQIPEGDK